MTGSSLNCWEFMRCGREPGGAEAVRLGCCPAAMDASYHGLNGGNNGGRICWAVAGTCCGGKVQGTFAEKRSSCVDCEFFQKVQQEQKEAHPSTKFLKLLCEDGRSILLSCLSYRRIRQGERFISQGEISDCAFVIDTGSCLLVVEKVPPCTPWTTGFLCSIGPVRAGFRGPVPSLERRILSVHACCPEGRGKTGRSLRRAEVAARFRPQSYRGSSWGHRTPDAGRPAAAGLRARTDGPDAA